MTKELDLGNEDFQIAFKLIEETNHSFFLTGRAGTGKSTFLKHVIKTTSKNCIVLAPTGIAAVNVGGSTIHSFFQFPLRPLLPEDEEIKIFWQKSEKRKIIAAMDTLFIDEISMVRADIIDGIDYSLRKNGGNPYLPFGGKQVIFIGDLFQLEPVSIKSTGEYDIVTDIYGSSYFYRAKVFNRLNLFTVELQKVYRQADPDFIELLDKVRVKEITQADINRINSRFLTENEIKRNDFAITLTTKNDLSDKVNVDKLSELNSPSCTFVAEVSGEFEESKYPTDPELTLKEGAQVIFTKNDSEKRWFNGTIGRIYQLTNEFIKVKLNDNSIHSVDKRVWENIKFQYDKKNRKIQQQIIGTFKQYPLKLAWSITIHKSQGLTFDKVVIDFGEGTFASGQAYVALSRATSFNGLFLKQKVNTTDIYIDEEIKEFAKSFNDRATIQNNLHTGRELFKFQRNNDLERVGIHYFKTAISNLKDGDFKSTFTNLMLGFECVSCDCSLVELIENNSNEINELFKLQTINCTIIELDFIRAVFYFFNDPVNSGREPSASIYKAQHFIDSFLEANPNSEIGHYFKGRILAGMGNFEDAISQYSLAASIKETPRTHYRIGRVREDKLDQFGTDHLLKSVLLNSSSICANRWLKDSANKRKLNLKTNTNSLLVNSFNIDETDKFLKMLNRILIDGEIELMNKETLSSSDTIIPYLDSLTTDMALFSNK